MPKPSGEPVASLSEGSPPPPLLRLAPLPPPPLLGPLRGADVQRADRELNEEERRAQKRQRRKDKKAAKAGEDVEKVKPKWRKGWEDLPTYGDVEFYSNFDIILDLDHFPRVSSSIMPPHAARAVLYLVSICTVC